MAAAVKGLHMPREDHTQLVRRGAGDTLYSLCVCLYSPKACGGCALQVLDISTPSRTTAAFFRWREARLKAHFKRQLQQILEEVSVEDHAAERLQHEVKKAHKRQGEQAHTAS